MTLASDPRRRVPRTDAVLAEPQIALAVARLGRALVKDAVAGAQDPATPPVRLEEVATAIPGARLEVLDDAAHLAPAEQPERTAELVRALVFGEGER